MKGTLLCCVLLPCLVQGNLTVSRLIYEADKSATAGNKEAAAADLVKAIALAEKLEARKVRAELLRRAQKALKRVDKDHGSAERGKKSAAKRLVALARKYEKKGWQASARDLALLAESLSRGSAGKLLKRLPPKKDSTVLNAQQAMQGSTSLLDGKAWRATDEDIRSDELKTNEEGHLLFAKAALESWSLTCSLNPERNGGRVGILFGHRSPTIYNRLSLRTDGKTLEVHLESIRGQQTQSLYAVRWKVSADELTKGIPLEISFDGKTLHFTPGRLLPRHIPLLLDSTIGHVGLWTRNTGKQPFRALFSKMTLSMQ